MATDDFFRARLDSMIDMRHALAVLATRMPWADIEAALAPVLAHKDRAGHHIEHSDLFGPTLQPVAAGVSNAGRPRLPVRLMVSLLYLKHAFNESDESLVERWSENVYWQFFSGMTHFEPRLPCDATQLGRFRRVLGEAGVEQLLQSTIEASVTMGAVNKSEFERVIVDTTVQEKAIAHPVDSRLLEIARHKVVSAAKRAGLVLKQTFAKEGKELRRKAGGYAHAKQFKRLRRTTKRQRTILGVVMRDARRRLAQLHAGIVAHEPSPLALADLQLWLERAERVRTQQRHSKNKLYALHAPEVRPPHGPLLAARQPGRRLARRAMRGGLQHPLAAAGHCAQGARSPLLTLIVLARHAQSAMDALNALTQATASHTARPTDPVGVAR